MTATALSLGQITDGLTDPGQYLGPAQFTYSIPTAASIWPGYSAPGDEPFNGYAIFNAAQASSFRLAIAAWDALIAPDFTEVADDATSRGEIRAAFTNVGAGVAGYAYLGQPWTPGTVIGDIWIDNGSVGESFAVGSFNYEVLLHESGHSLGLDHPFENASIPSNYENTTYTIMSYTDSPASTVVTFSRSGNSIFANFAAAVQVTPMVLDIAAVQSLYGAETTTAAGDTVYSFNQNDNFRQSIYDAGGNDTIDLSSFTRPNNIDLRPGAYSDIGVFSREAQVAYWTALYPGFGSFIPNQLARGDLYTHTLNLGIAFSTVIENAIGGSAVDTMIGNDVANRLEGRGGNDVIDGGLGDDLLSGGLGADALAGGAGSDTAFYNDVLGAVFVNLTLGRGFGNAAEGDTLAGIENVIGSAGNDTLIGDGLGNRLDGEAGDDVLRGAFGSDILVGGLGIDVASYEDNQGAVFVDLLRGVGFNNSAQGDSFDSIENLAGSIYGDVFIGTNGVNRIDGLAGDDIILGGLGGDAIIGGDGIDTASFEDNQGAVFVNLALAQGFGNAAEGDSYAGIENLVGTVFYDTFLGNDAANRLDGQRGADSLTGGGGADIFAFTTALDGVVNIDTITDFASGSDRIELARAVFAALPAGGVLAASAFVTGAAATAAEQRIVYDAASGRLFYDADGNGAGAAVLFAVLDSRPVIGVGDFVIA